MRTKTGILFACKRRNDVERPSSLSLEDVSSKLTSVQGGMLDQLYRSVEKRPVVMLVGFLTRHFACVPHRWFFSRARFNFSRFFGGRSLAGDYGNSCLERRVWKPVICPQNDPAKLLCVRFHMHACVHTTCMLVVLRTVVHLACKLVICFFDRLQVIVHVEITYNGVNKV